MAPTDVVRRLAAFLIAASLFPVVGLAQATQPVTTSRDAEVTSAPAEDAGPLVTAQKPGETREQMLQRFGLVVDPGADPDPQKKFVRFGKRFTIERFEKKYSKPSTTPGWVHPFVYVNAEAELYQQNNLYVWVFMPEPEGAVEQPKDPQGNPIQVKSYGAEDLKYIRMMKPDFTPLDPPVSNVTVRFHESSAGLPVKGSWRNSPAVADMNEDGNLDIIAPPQRSALDNSPTIFLGDGKGGWKEWNVRWPVALAYGSVVAGDVNKDGHQDLVFAVHQHGVEVLLGDGKGNFTQSDAGLPDDYPTRRVRLADFNGDGYPDIAVLTEGPTVMQLIEQKPKTPKLRIYLNQKGKSWKLQDVVEVGRDMGGDFMNIARFRGGKLPDVVTSSNVMNGPDIFYLSDAPMKLAPWGRGDLPFWSYYHANAVGKFSSSKRDDAIVSFTRFWTKDIDPAVEPWPDYTSTAGLERISFTDKGVKRTPIMRWPSDKPVWSMASGDFDGDGNLDVIFRRFSPNDFVLLLGDGKGGFRRAKLDGLEPMANANYDISVADVNKDGRPDLVIFYEAEESKSNGSVRVYLNDGKVSSAASSPRTK